MSQQQRLCIVSRGRTNLFGYLTAALMPTEGLEFVVDRRGTRRVAPIPGEPTNGQATSDERWIGGDRRHGAGLDRELSARGWVLLKRDPTSDTWAPDPNALKAAAGPRRPPRARSRREWRAFMYIGGATIAIALVGALVGLVVVGGYRLPASFVWSGLPAHLTNTR